MSKQKKYHYIYKTTCSVTGKFYVGMHSTDNLEDGYLGSGKILGYSRQKHGDENHTKTILEYCSSRVELKQREKDIVNETLLSNPLNMNLKYGGEGGWEHVVKTCANLTSAKFLEYKTSGRLAENFAKAQKSRTKESYLKASAKAWKNPTKEMLNGQKAATLAATKTEVNDKRKATMAEHFHSTGEKNSQYGTCWVTDGIKPVKIKKDSLDEYLAKGFVSGRVMR